MEQFKVRASAAGKIMTEAAGKSNTEKLIEAKAKWADTQSKLDALSDKAVKMQEKYRTMIEGYEATVAGLETLLAFGVDKDLSKTCTSYLLEWYIEQSTGRRKEISSKYLSKGIAVEGDAIVQIALQDEAFHTKNEKNYRNDWFTGTPDIIADNKVIDIKSSWDIFTFTNAKINPIDEGYYYQLQVYMDLLGMDNAELIYCLMNTPDSVYESELRKAEWSTGVHKPLSDAELTQFKLNHTFDDLPYESRFVRFYFERDQEVIDKIKSRVEQCRGFIETNFTNIF
jgi:hypothetical protein